MKTMLGAVVASLFVVSVAAFAGTRTRGAAVVPVAPEVATAPAAPSPEVSVVEPPPVAVGGTASLYQESYDAEATGKLADALASMERLAASDADAYLVELRRGWLLHRLGRNVEAAVAYAKACDAAPRSVEARVGALAVLVALRRWATAETTAREALQLDPGNYLASLRLAYSLYNRGHYGEAKALYQGLTEAYPSDTDARAGLGWSLLKLGKGFEAAKTFRAILDVAPRHALARDGLKASGLSR